MRAPDDLPVVAGARELHPGDAYPIGAGFVRVHSGLDGSLLHRFEGQTTAMQFGVPPSGVGGADVNADGYADGTGTATLSFRWPGATELYSQLWVPDAPRASSQGLRGRANGTGPAGRRRSPSSMTYHFPGRLRGRSGNG